MLPHLWLLTLLAPLALAVPVPRESNTPSLRLSDSKSDTKTSNSREHLGLNRANKAIWNLKGEEVKAGSKTTVVDKGSPSLGGYSAHGTGISYSLSTGTPGKPSRGTSERKPGGGSGRSARQMSGGLSDGGTSKGLKGRRSYGVHGGHGEDGDGMKGGKMQEQLQSHGSGSASDSASKAGSEDMTTGSEGTTTGNDSTGTTGNTTDSENTIGGTTTSGKGATREESTTSGDGITTSTSKHK